MSIFAEGQITPIMEKVGKDALQRDRYRRANFELLLWSSTKGGNQEYYINTVGMNKAYSPTLTNDEQNGLEFGFCSPNAIFIEAHNANGKTDAWPALHYVGAV